MGVDPLKISSVLQGHTGAPLLMNLTAGAIAWRAGLQANLRSARMSAGALPVRSTKGLLPSDVPSSERWCLVRDATAVDASSAVEAQWQPTLGPKVRRVDQGEQADGDLLATCLFCMT